MSSEIGIDWASADVRNGRLTVALAATAPKDWVQTTADVIERLARSGHGWGEVKVTRKRFRVADVEPGAEPSLRHFLESALMQANSALEDENDEQEPGDGDSRSDADRQMTETFRSFAD